MNETVKRVLQERKKQIFDNISDIDAVINTKQREINQLVDKRQKLIFEVEEIELHLNPSSVEEEKKQ